MHARKHVCENIKFYTLYTFVRNGCALCALPTVYILDTIRIDSSSWKLGVRFSQPFFQFARRLFYFFSLSLSLSFSLCYLFIYRDKLLIFVIACIVSFPLFFFSNSNFLYISLSFDIHVSFRLYTGKRVSFLFLYIPSKANTCRLLCGRDYRRRHPFLPSPSIPCSVMYSCLFANHAQQSAAPDFRQACFVPSLAPLCRVCSLCALESWLRTVCAHSTYTVCIYTNRGRKGSPRLSSSKVRGDDEPRLFPLPLSVAGVCVMRDHAWQAPVIPVSESIGFLLKPVAAVGPYCALLPFYFPRPLQFRLSLCIYTYIYVFM